MMKSWNHFPTLFPNNCNNVFFPPFPWSPTPFCVSKIFPSLFVFFVVFCFVCASFYVCVFVCTCAHIQSLFPRVVIAIRPMCVGQCYRYQKTTIFTERNQLFKTWWKHDISSASERAFPGFFGDIFGCSTLSKKRCFSTQEFTRFLSTVSSQRRTTRSDVSWFDFLVTFELTPHT